MIIGAGPAGLFAALILSEAGMNPIIIERGQDVAKRKAKVDDFFSSSKLDENSNTLFGEGGAGTFSDGKLLTGIKDHRIEKVISEFINFGAPDEISYSAKPHIGTDKLFTVLLNMRKKIESLGGEYRFNTLMKDVEIRDGCLKAATVEDLTTGEVTSLPCDFLILAIGHSARDTFEMLEKRGVVMEAKPFSIGLRIEHKQEMINRAQYGDFWDHEKLGAADYKLSVDSKGRGVYTFCMCPGGSVIAAASEAGHLAVNGMSLYARDGENANSAVLVSVSPSDFEGDSPLRGMYFQRELEEKAYKLGGSNYFAPVQLVEDFIAGRKTAALGDVIPSYKPGYTLADINTILPEFISAPLKDAFEKMGKKIRYFDRNDAVLTAVESRSSSPIRICRNTALEANFSGIIPSGEGAGYAGGILSACVDGIKCAESLIKLVDMRGVSK